jgi:hypothetical protein
MKPTTSNTPAFVDLETAARLAGVTRRTVQSKLASREIPRKAVRMDGRRKMIAVAALAAVFGALHPAAKASPSQGEAGGERHGNFHEAAEVVELRAKVAARDTIIASLQTTLDHERADRAHERENWRQTLERTQGNLLAAQDTPTARAIAGASKVATIQVATQVAAVPKKARRPRKAAPRWWRSWLAV